MDITIRDICKYYGDNRVLNQISFDISSGEIISIVGPSGSGKTTFLHILAGLLPASAGVIYINGQEICNIPTEVRNIGFVFQDPSLYPNLTVYKNIAFPLEMQRQNKSYIQEKVVSVANMLHITHLLKRKPHQLSGGEQQRVAIARAFVKQPELILFDEPFSSLDARLALELREELKKLLKSTSTTAIFVTHCQDDAISISDRIAVLCNGQLLQYDSPANVYNRPNCPFVANFIGKYPINAICGTVANGLFHSNDNSITIPSTFTGTTSTIQLFFRPESLSTIPQGSSVRINGKVVDVFTTGKENVVTVQIGENMLRLYAPPDLFPAIGDFLSLYLDIARVFFFENQEEHP